MGEADAEVQRLEGVIRRNEMERGRRRDEWEENTNQLKQKWWDEKHEWKRTNTGLKEQVERTNTVNSFCFYEALA